MFVRGHVELGKERQAHDVGDGTDQQQLGEADAADAAAANTADADDTNTDQQFHVADTQQWLRSGYTM